MSILVTSNLKVNYEPKITQILIRDTKNFNDEAFIEDLSENLNDPTNNFDHDINQCMSDFIKIFQSILNKHAPIRTQTRKEKKLKRKPWLTKSLLQSIKQKNKMYAQCIKEKMISYGKIINNTETN